MKRNISIYSSCLLILCVLAGSSCKKILEQTPKNATYDEVYWKTGRDYRSALAGNYALLRDAITNKNNRYYMYGDAIAKNYFTMDYTGDGLEGIQNGDFSFQYNLNSLGNWTMYYKVITMSNLIIERLATATDEDFSDENNIAQFRNRAKGQALYIRALTYFMLTRVWGDVPVVTEYYDNPIAAPQLPRTPAADVYKLIENDCKEAASLLDWGYNNMTSLERAVTANRGSVYALLTHLYLWRATMTNLASNVPIASDVNSADTTLTRLLAEGGYSYADTSDYYLPFVGRSASSVSPEGIFQIYMDEKTQEGSNAHIGMSFLRGDKYISYFGDDARFWVPNAYFSNNYTYPKKFYNPEHTTDPSKPDSVIAYVTDTTDVRFKKNFEDLSSSQPMCIKYHNASYRNATQSLDAYLSNDIVIFRYADMRLLKAEIALYKNDFATAISVINASRINRNGGNIYYGNLALATDSKDELMRKYIMERGRELYVEGHLFYDLLRTRQCSAGFVDWLSDENRFIGGGFYWPVDPQLFQNNKLLIQTSYWRGKI